MQQNEQQAADSLYRLRHSLAHIMAQAVLELRPGSKLGFGPPIDDGFYYDFILTTPLTEDDFPLIEEKMKAIIRSGQSFISEELPSEKALERIEQMGEPYKKEYAEELVKKNQLTSLSFYTNGPFLDMCEGPHVTTSKEIPTDCFKIRSIAGAYWRGDSRNAMMTRLYAWAFKTKDELKSYIKAYEEAQKRDHKKLGKELNLFVIDNEVGKGLPLWCPNGTVLRTEIEKLVCELEFKDGYQKVATPHITKGELYYKTGHLPYYADGMFPPMELVEKENGKEVVKETYYLRPMNCPHHHKIFASSPRSYRELPLRLSEYGQVYRFEDSGSLAGLARVRGMCMNDAHIYCAEEQIRDEFLRVMRLTQKLYSVFGLHDFYMRFSTWDPEDPKGKQKYIDDPTAWVRSQDMIRAAMEESGLPFYERKGEAAFYGPKIDVQFKLVTGREETMSTNQLDFGVPPRLNLVYTDRNNVEKNPYVIHRAPASTHERFIAFLIEHFGGAFPTWLAPIQVKFITVNGELIEYAQKLSDELRELMIRSEVDTTNETLNKKIRTHTKQKVPNLIIIGENERQQGTVTLRRYGIEQQKTMPWGEFKAWITEEISQRKLPAYLSSL